MAPKPRLNQKQSDADDATASPLSSFSTKLVTSIFGVAIGYSIFWGAFQSLLVGHVYSNDGRFVAVASNPIVRPAPKSTASNADGDEDGAGGTAEIGDALEIWYGRGTHRSVINPCQMDFAFTGMTITNYQFGSDRHKNPHQAKYLPVTGFQREPKEPGPYVFIKFDTPLGPSPVHLMTFDFEKDVKKSAYSGMPVGADYFTGSASLSLNPWECISTIFVGGGFQVVDFSDFKFLAEKTASGQLLQNTAN